MNITAAVAAYVAESVDNDSMPVEDLRLAQRVLRELVGFVGERPVRSLKTAHVQSFLLRHDDNAVARTELRAVRGFCRWLVEAGHVKEEATAPLFVASLPSSDALSRPLSRMMPHEVDRRHVEAFVLDQRRRHLAPKTIDYRNQRLVDLATFVHPRSVTEATPSDIEAWLDTYKIGVRSRHTYLSVVRSFFDYLERSQVVTSNPARSIPLPRLRRLMPRPIADEDLRTAIGGASPRMKAWLSLAAYQGMRCKEIAGLRVEDLLVDHDPPLLLVSAGKGGHERILPLNPLALRALRSYGLPSSGFVFLNRFGREHSPESVSREIRRYMAACGIEATAHQLRHWFATTVYAKSGGDLRLTQEMLGHVSPQTTAIYAAYSPAGAATAVQALGV